MIYRKQNSFDHFRCTSGQCPKSCCIGWQIMIDENSLKKYQSYTGPFSDRLQASVNCRAQAFRQHHTRCDLLNSNGLCDLQATLGESFLCDTCRLYPRHTEEFQDLREYSLSLSCPEVTRMVLDPDYTFGFTESKDELYDVPEEFEDFDVFLFDQLEYARDKMFVIASDRKRSLWERMKHISMIAWRLQNLYDEGELLAMADVDYDSVFFDVKAVSGIEGSYEHCLQSLKLLMDMEVLETSWTETIFAVRDYWGNHPSFSDEWSAALHPSADLEYVFEKILASLLFTYFCGAVYDGQIYARAMIAVQSVRSLLLIHAATQEDVAPLIYLYSREVEHSDDNINSMISYFEAELP